MMRLVRPAVLVLLLLPVAGAAHAGADEDWRFMPPGGKTIFLESAGAEAASEILKIGGSARSENEWRAYWQEKHPQLGAREITEVAVYLAINLPLPREAFEQAASNPAAGLPPDGRELAWERCQSCHSLYSGYLMQQRDVQGWRSVFLSPFHRNLKLTASERETFARYSAFNMPIKPADVPPSLRY